MNFISREDYDSVVSEYINSLINLGYSIYPHGSYSNKDGEIDAVLTNDIDGCRLVATLKSSCKGDSYKIESQFRVNDSVVSESKTSYSKIRKEEKREEDKEVHKVEEIVENKEGDKVEEKKLEEKSRREYKESFFDDLANRILRNLYLY